MIRSFKLAFALLVLLSGCLYRVPGFDEATVIPPQKEAPPLPEGPALRALVLGDWGTGGPGQQDLARAIEWIHGQAPPLGGSNQAAHHPVLMTVACPGPYSSSGVLWRHAAQRLSSDRSG